MKWESGLDADFTFGIGDEVTYSEDNKDYTVLKRLNITGMGKYYLTRACDPANPVQQLNVKVEDESKLTKASCLSALTKVLATLTYDGNFHKTENYIRNTILNRICDLHETVTHNIKFYVEGDSFKMDFDESTLTLNNA